MEASPAEQTVVPAQSGAAVAAKQGDQIKVIDPKGFQIGDMWAISINDPGEWLGAGSTRIALEQLFPDVGQAFSTNRMREILRLVEDNSPGVHDMLHPSCDTHLYQHWLGTPDHPNCTENFRTATAAAGVELPVVPQPVNLFQNTQVDGDGQIHVGTAASRPGDSVVFEAEMDLLFVLTACAADWNEVNGPACTELVIELTSLRSA